MSVKLDVEFLLDNKEFEKLADLASSNKSIIRYVFSFLYSTNDLLHWRAAEALGMLAYRQRLLKQDEGRNIPRRLVWSLAEESGATSWAAPEALGAVVAMQPNELSVFATITLSFIDDPVFRRGVLWAARKIAEKRPDLTRNYIPKVIELLKDCDPTIRGHAAWALGPMKAHQAMMGLMDLKNDCSKLFIYDLHELQETTVGDIAAKSIVELRN